MLYFIQVIETDLYHFLRNLGLDEDEYEPPTLVYGCEGPTPLVSDILEGGETFTLDWLQEYSFRVLLANFILTLVTLPTLPFTVVESVKN